MATYKTSTITLYTASSAIKWPLLPHKLFIVESLDRFLNSQTFQTFNLVQYQKPTLELEIVLDLSQTNAEPLNASFKYARIVNSDAPLQYYYYFIKKVEWRAKSAVRFHLVMDVLNTFKEGTHYTFKANTKITREHKDRFIIKDRQFVLTVDEVSSAVGTLNEGNTVILRNMDQDNLYLFTAKIISYEDGFLNLLIIDDISKAQIETLFAPITQYSDLVSVVKDSGNYIETYFSAYSFNFQYFRNIDYIQENINPILQCGNATGVKIENNKTLLQCDWYLLYRNQADPDPADYLNPVECYLIPENEIEVNSTDIVSGRVNASSLVLNAYYYLECNSPTQTITLDNGTTLTAASSPDRRIIELKRNSDNTITVTSFKGNSSFDEILTWTCKYITLLTIPFTYHVFATKAPTTSFTELENNVNVMPEHTWDNTATPIVINDITKLDKTDPRNIKLIKLPYCPYDFTITSSKLDIASDTNWDTVGLIQADSTNIIILRLNDLNTALHSTLTLSSSNDNPLNNLEIPTLSPSVNDLRLGEDYESKLFNSEFYRGTYVYDSFQFGIQLEKCDTDYYLLGHNLTIYFDMTKTINSKFMFTFDSYYLRNATESYVKYMPIARNNEEVLYNVPYINYVRTGFNYDVKAKNISNISNWVGAGLSIAGVAASFIMPTAPLKALGVVTSLISMAMTTKNAITSTIQNEQSIERKLKEASMQTASVAGSDDVDLMSVYAENRLKYLVYEPNPVMKNMLYDLFFYAGYASNRLGIPKHDTRVNFDYLECDAVIDTVANIPDDCLTELVNSFKYGVTYIHRVTTRVLENWDFDQKYENWEVNLL